jgi:DNA-binding MarR family transcriptional regulator
VTSRDVSDHRLIEEVGRLLMRARRMVWSAAARHLEATGESMLAWNLIGCIIRYGASTQRELAETIAQHPAGVCRLVEELESRGLVKCARDVTDRRKINVRVTAAGRRHFETLRPGVVGSVEVALSRLTPIERRTLRDLLGKMTSAELSEIDEGGGAKVRVAR